MRFSLSSIFYRKKLVKERFPRNIGHRRGSPDNIEAVNTSDSETRRGRKKAAKLNLALPETSEHLSMFGDNNLIQGGEFVINNVNSDKVCFQLLQQHVATAAFHDSAQRVDPPRCHPKTRTAVLQMMYDWIVNSSLEHRETWLLWLNGAAGAGKSAIMQSIAERCALAQVAIASFFFFRSDPTRNNVGPLVATLVYQLIQAIPETADDILLTIESNPLIFEQSVEHQLRQLIVAPLLHIQGELERLFVILIDGLDECIDRRAQTSLIDVLTSVLGGKEVPILFFIASRQEPQLTMAFRDEDIAEILTTMALDNVQQASCDIRIFLADKFAQIKRSHPYAHNLPESWPASSAINQIVEKSSGQFIYASVVVNYISTPRANPALQLEIINGLRLRRPSSQNPFAHLDALYQYIFSQVEDLDMVLDIIAFSILAKEQEIDTIQHIFQLSFGELEVCLADLTSVISCGPNIRRGAEIKFLHASLPDFLLDKRRSEIYYISPNRFRTKLSCMLLNRPVLSLKTFPLTNNLNVVSKPEWYRLRAIWVLLEGAKASDELHRSFLNFNMMFYHAETAKLSANHCIWVLECLDCLNFDDQRQVHRHLAGVFAPCIARAWSSITNDIKKMMAVRYPELVDHINRIKIQGNEYRSYFDTVSCM